MFRFFLFLIAFVLILFLSFFIINNSFDISVEIKDFIYSISSEYIFFILLLCFVIFFIVQGSYFKIKFGLKKFSINKKMKKKEKGYNAFLSGMIALANKDYKTAISESKKISYHIDDNPSLSLLLKSEIYKIEKKYDQLRDVYEEMARNKNTENLAFRGIMEQYLRAQDYHHAFIYGEKLFNNNPYIEKIYDALVNIVVKTTNWQQLIIISDKAFSKKLISKKVYEENKSIAYFEISKIKQPSAIKESIVFIKKALNLRNYFPPYVKLYLELLIENKDYNLAKKYIKKIWNNRPHNDYKSIIQSLAFGLNIDYFDLVKFIIANNINNDESKILMVEAAIELKKWEKARREIKPLLGVHPSREICILMARIEEGDEGSIEKINSWNFRSKNGIEKNAWICLFSNKSQDHWSSVSSGGYFNSLEWRQPTMLNSDNFPRDIFLNEDK